jgi:hypothetical protein
VSWEIHFGTAQSKTSEHNFDQILIRWGADGLVFMAMAKSFWGNGSNVLESAMKFSSQTNLDSSKVAQLMRLTVLGSIARRLVTKVLGSLELGQLTSVSTTCLIPC